MTLQDSPKTTFGGDGATPLRIAAVAVLVCLAAAVYLNALDNPFVFDDRTEILENPSIVSLENIEAVIRHTRTRPVTNLSYAVDFSLWGLNPLGYHLTNLLLHIVNVILVYWLATTLHDDFGSSCSGAAQRVLVPFSTAALFAVHPMMTEAVGYVSGRAEVLCASFFLASVLGFRSCLGRRGPSLVGAAVAAGVFFCLALAAKEVAVTLPAVLLVYDLLLIQRSAGAWRRRFWRLHAPLLAAGLAVAAVRTWLYVTVEQSQAAGFDWRNLLVTLHVTERYLGLLVFPAWQSVVHAVYPFRSLWDPRVVTSMAVLAGAIGAAVVARRREPRITLGLSWWFLVLMPSSMLILLAGRGQPMAEHRIYLASCGFFIACGGLVSQYLQGATTLAHTRGRVAAAMLGLVLTVLAGLTVARNRVWDDPVQLWEDAARKAPRTWAAQYGVADAHREAGDCESARAAYRRATALLPHDVRAYLGFAECSAVLGDIGEARDALREAVNRAPRDVRPRLALAALEARGFNRPEEALRLCREAQTISPEHPEVLDCLRRYAPGGTRPGG